MYRYIASCQVAAGGIPVQIRYGDVEGIRLVRIARGVNHQLEIHDLPIIDDTYTCAPDMIAVDHQQLERCGFQPQIGSVILVGQVAFRRWITPKQVMGLSDYVYLKAHCHLRNAERNFRLDRIIEIRVEIEK